MSLFAQWRNLPVVQKQRTVAHIRAGTSRKRRFERCLETSDRGMHETEQIHVYGCFHKEKDGYSVRFPQLDGCLTEGDDFQSALRMAQEAMSLHLYGMEQDGEEILNLYWNPWKWHRGNAGARYLLEKVVKVTHST